MKKNPLCLVTGACGFMGSHMVEVLAEAGYRVRATDLPSAFRGDDLNKGLFPSVVRKCGAEIRPADLTDRKSLDEVCSGVQWVFHVAGLFGYSARWDALYAVNVEGTQNLCDALEKSGELERFIMWGAGGVYGLPTEDKLPLTEDMPTDPPNDYLRSKDLAEKEVMKFCQQHGVAHAVLRPTTVYGPRAVYGGGQLVKGLYKLNPVMVPANFTARIPFVHVRDVVGAALHLASRADGISGPYNVNDDSQLTMIDTMRFFAMMSGAAFIKLPPIPVGAVRRGLVGVASVVQKVMRDYLKRQSPLEPDSIEYLNRDFVYSNDKLKGTGYEFVYPDPRPGLRDTVMWYKQQGWL